MSRRARAFEFDAHGWLRHARIVPSPNADDRPDPNDISLLVIHAISLPPGQFGGNCVEQLFTNVLDCDAHPSFADLRTLCVSAHFLIDRAGAVAQFVSVRRRAWHAGVSSFGGRTHCNDFSVGVELEGTDTGPFTDAQYGQLVPLAQALMRACPAITPARVAGHSDIAPGRKTDPGCGFDWPRLREALAQAGAAQ